MIMMTIAGGTRWERPQATKQGKTLLPVADAVNGGLLKMVRIFANVANV